MTARESTKYYYLPFIIEGALIYIDDISNTVFSTPMIDVHWLCGICQEIITAETSILVYIWQTPINEMYPNVHMLMYTDDIAIFNDSIGRIQRQLNVFGDLKWWNLKWWNYAWK